MSIYLLVRVILIFVFYILPSSNAGQDDGDDFLSPFHNSSHEVCVFKILKVSGWWIRSIGDFFSNALGRATSQFFHIVPLSLHLGNFFFSSLAQISCSENHLFTYVMCLNSLRRALARVLYCSGRS